MADLPAARRMRRFRDKDGVEYDELPGGQLRRRLKSGDTSPIPQPQPRKAIERRAGQLREIDPAALAKETGMWRQRCTRCGKTTCHGCATGRRKGQHQ